MILVTGFDPFGGEARNASFEAVRGLDGESIGDETIVVRELPTEFEAAPRRLAELIAELAPKVVVATGQAGPRDPVRVEIELRNEIDAPIADNAGVRLRGAFVDVFGVDVRRPEVDVGSVLRSIDASHGVVLSRDAGRFVCNALAYRLVDCGVPSLFVHVPSYGDRDEAERCALDARSRAAIRAIVRALVDVACGTLGTRTL